jgi:hypothetical protein
MADPDIDGEVLATRRCPFCAWVGIPPEDGPDTECPDCGHGTVRYLITRT